MSLLTYEEVRPWAKSIKQKVLAREMPPWYIDKNVGVRHFKNDVSLSDEEIATIVNWVDAGAPKGNPADMPRAAQVRRFRQVAHGSARSDRRTAERPADTRPRVRPVDRCACGYRSDGGSVYQRDRSQTHQGFQSGPPRDDVHEARGRSRRWRQRPGNLPQRVRAGQERRRVPGRRGPFDQGGNEDQLQSSSPPDGPGDARERGARPQVLSQGLHAEVLPRPRKKSATRRISTFRPTPTTCASMPTTR